MRAYLLFMAALLAMCASGWAGSVVARVEVLGYFDPLAAARCVWAMIDVAGVVFCLYWRRRT